MHEFFNREPENWNILAFLEECNLPLFKQKIELYLTSLEAISDTQKAFGSVGAMTLGHAPIKSLGQATKQCWGARQHLWEFLTFETLGRLGTCPTRRKKHLWDFLRLRLRVDLWAKSDNGSDCAHARDWKNEKKTKPVDKTSVHFHQVTATDNSMIGINNGSFDVSSKSKRSTRKRKSICYSESSEEDHLSDPDYAEKSERKQKSRSKRSRGKANRDKGIIIPSVETSEEQTTMLFTLKDTTLHEITSQQSLTSEYIAISHKDTPCPVTQSTQQTSLNTISTSRDTPRSVIQSTQQASIFAPQKPIITKAMRDRYSLYLICAFNSTINYIKESVEEEVYTEIKNLLQAKDRLILQETNN
ncbi:3265_t:CDS:2 [Paraglomus brasilianum]|uniref:3265_t:CDS:1 n=1 Tax=Paraglomus brasilianum TaxID=144538 RepID=A0A9N9C6J5_9GLOM|nr:3265_t:CDS:2 [Paraglomus brasilianum]